MPEQLAQMYGMMGDKSLLSITLVCNRYREGR